MVAVIVPDESAAKKWAANEGLTVDFEELCTLEQTNKYIMSELASKGKELGLFGFEVPRAIHIHNALMTPESDLMTPTFKLKRNIAEKFFRPQIDQMYGH